MNINHKKYFLIGLLFLPVIIYGCIWGVGHFLREPIYPFSNNGYWVDTYSDCDDKPPGQSHITSFYNDSSQIFCEFILDSGYLYPYAGFLIGNAKGDGYINLKSYNKLHLVVATQSSAAFQVTLLTNVEDFTKKNDFQSQRYNTSSLLLKGGVQVRDIPFSYFQTPYWWYEYWKKRPMDFPDKPELKKTLGISFQSSQFTKLNKKIGIRILEIYAYYDMQQVYKTFIWVTIVFYVIISVWYGARWYHYKKGAAVIPYEKLTVTNHADNDLDRIVEYIGKNFSESNLSLNDITKNTGVSLGNISHLLQKKFNKDFTHYLQGIRLFEATRLLTNTDRQVTEIALMVGFNYVSSFTRAYKTQHGKTPKEVR